MKRAVVFTAFDRLYYLEKVLKSWTKVREKEGWDFYFSVDDGPSAGRAVEIIRTNTSEWPSWCNIHIVSQPKNLGVLEHPYILFEEAFKKYDFVLRAEDDLEVSDDILEYFMWASEEFKADESVATVIGYSEHDFPEGTNVAACIPEFGPWIFGTWKNRWSEYIGPTWDRDYSTFNDVEGNQSGWDWNLNTRVLPALGKVNVVPHYSRVNNIGVTGTHAKVEEYVTSSTFRPSYAPNKIFRSI